MLVLWMYGAFANSAVVMGQFWLWVEGMSMWIPQHAASESTSLHRGAVRIQRLETYFNGVLGNNKRGEAEMLADVTVPSQQPAFLPCTYLSGAISATAQPPGPTCRGSVSVSQRHEKKYDRSRLGLNPWPLFLRLTRRSGAVSMMHRSLASGRRAPSRKQFKSKPADMPRKQKCPGRR